jgi:hypothetical protein
MSPISSTPSRPTSARADRRQRLGSRPTAAQRQAARVRLAMLTRLLDSAVAVPILRTRIGLDALLGLLPGVGDLVSGAIGLLLIRDARVLGASRWLQARMLMNLLVDAAAGSVPLAGDLFDVYFKAHERNLQLLRRELGEPWLDGEIVADTRDTRPD